MPPSARPVVVFVTHHLPWPACNGGRVREGQLLCRLTDRFDIEVVAVSKVPELDGRHLQEAASHGVRARIFAAQSSRRNHAGPLARRHGSPAAREYLDHLLRERVGVVHVEGHYLLGLVPERVNLHNGVPAPAGPGLNAMRADRAAVRTLLGVPVGATVLGSVGRLSPEKRIDLFLSAGRRLVPDRPDLHLLVVGGGEQRSHLEAEARRAGLRGRVTFSGLLRDVTPALVAMDILVQPSDTEGTPRSVVEAMAHQVPVVATDVGDVADVIAHGHCGELVPPGDDRVLARAISRLLDDPAYTAELAARAQSRYKDWYTIETMRERVDEAYRRARKMCFPGAGP